MEAASDFGKELLKSVGAVCWTLYEPSHIRRVAQAEADGFSTAATDTARRKGSFAARRSSPTAGNPY
jgi:hypothetical protein